MVSLACNDSHITDAVMLTNQTDQVLQFTIVLEDGSDFALNKTAMPGETIRLLDGSQLSDGAGIMRGRCTVGELRGLGPDGQTVSRLPPPICAPTTVVMSPVAGSS